MGRFLSIILLLSASSLADWMSFVCSARQLTCISNPNSYWHVLYHPDWAHRWFSIEEWSLYRIVCQRMSKDCQESQLICPLHHDHPIDAQHIHLLETNVVCVDDRSIREKRMRMNYQRKSPNDCNVFHEWILSYLLAEHAQLNCSGLVWTWRSCWSKLNLAKLTVDRSKMQSFLDSYSFWSFQKHERCDDSIASTYCNSLQLLRHVACRFAFIDR